MGIYRPLPTEPAPTTPDFTGSADGGGYKSVMDSPKTPLELLDPYFLEGVAEVLKHGATKYAPNNWRRGMSWTVVLGGILRHVTAFARGEEYDSESNLPHLHHAACGIMFLAHYAHTEREEHRPFDDRVYRCI
jgi:hypothetical protein